MKAIGNWQYKIIQQDLYATNTRMVKKLFIFFFVRGCKNTGSGDGEGVMIFKCMERRKIFHLYRIMEKYFNEIQNGCICYE